MTANPAIVGIGMALPVKCTPNSELDIFKSDPGREAAIRRITHIEQRYQASDDELTWTLGTLAAQRALKSAGLEPEAVDSLYLASLTPDQITPSTASLIHHGLSLPRTTSALDINAACAGAVYGLRLATQDRMTADPSRVSLVVCSERTSAIVDPTDKSTAPLFGDAAGAFVVGRAEDARQPKFASLTLTADQEGNPKSDILQVPQGEKHLRMVGKLVAADACQLMPEAALEAIRQAGLADPYTGLPDWTNIDWFVPHQANGSLMEEAAKALGAPPEQCLMDGVRYFGNTSSASIPTALAHAIEHDQIKPGQNYTLAMTAIGAGMVAGGAVIDLRLPEAA